MKLKKPLLSFAWMIFIPVIITGNVFYEERLDPASIGISLNSILFILSFILMSKSMLPKIFQISIFMIMPIILYVLWLESPSSSSHLNYEGIYKYLNYILIGSLGSVILYKASIEASLEHLFKILIFSFILLFLLTVIWKIKHGFFDRHVIYFMNGPIVFGRHMAIGLLLTILFNPKELKYRSLLITIFTFGLIWSLSKGPILSALVVVMLIYLKTNFRIFLGMLTISTLLFFSLITGAIDLSDTKFKRMQVGIQILYSGIDKDNGGSVGVRNDMYKETINLIQENPFLGVGFGNWSNSFTTDFTYPHNIFLEVISEIGLLSIVILLPILGFLMYPKNLLFPIALFLLLAQQVSGNLADARWLLMFALVIIFTKRKGESFATNN